MYITRIIVTYIWFNPLAQFNINTLFNLYFTLGNLNISITNIGLYLGLAAFFILVLNVLPNFKKMVNNKWFIVLESLYATVHSIVRNQINSKKGQIYFPFIYVLFIFILLNNLIGMTPYSFAPTSHFILTFALSFTIILGLTIIGFLTYGLKFFSLLVPQGCPLILLPLLVLIELISFLARCISLGLRLAANILSGHMLLNILAGFIYKIITKGGLLFFLAGLPPFIFLMSFLGLEVGLSFIQAQVFVVLSSSYIKESLDLH